LYLCFDVGGTSIKAGLIDDLGNILGKMSVATRVQEGADNVVAQLAEIRNELCRNLGILPSSVRAAGIGVPGFIEIETGIVTRAVNLGWYNVPVTEKAAQVLGIPVAVINDANAAALGEMWQGAGKGEDNVICLTLGTGIGAGVIVDGKAVIGKNGLAGEIGHFCVRIENGRRCACGKTGCLETESSASAIGYYGTVEAEKGNSPLLAVKLKEVGKITSRDVTEAARQGDEAARNVIEQAAFYLGFALANIFTVNAPSRFIIGGGAAAAGDLLFKPTISSFTRFSFAGIKGEDIIVPAILGNDAGIIGLAKLADMKLKSTYPSGKDE
jgi:glucokinase